MDKENLERQVISYIKLLREKEKCSVTIEQYKRDIANFLDYLGNRELNKLTVLAYKKKLESIYQISSVNTKIVALNGFFSFIGRDDLRLKLLKRQKRVFCSKDNELTKNEYMKLVKTAERNHDRKLSLILQTICSTGIRVSELQFVTAEALKSGEAEVRLKGKTRTILLPGKLRKSLKQYMYQEKIISGPIFKTRTGKPLDRTNIWRMMKNLCQDAGVSSRKVFPHNLRHLFARTFYSKDKDIVKLADILGHSDINTTRIYIVTTIEEHLKRMDSLELVI